MLILSSLHYAHAGVTLKNLTQAQYKRLVIPHLNEINQAYLKIFTKIDPKLKSVTQYIPTSKQLLTDLQKLREQCSIDQLSYLKCQQDLNSFKQKIKPYFNFWKEQITSDSTSSAIKITQGLQHFIKTQTSPPVGEKNIYIPPRSSLLPLYIQGYIFLLSKVKQRHNDLNTLWGNGVSIIVQDILLNYELAPETSLIFFKKHIDQINLQINETRMIWTRRQKVKWNLQKSINYIHSQWNFMLKSTLKF